MALTGKQRAAMLLMSLDASTAAELLKGVDAEVVKELAVELACLDAAGYRNSKQSLEFARQFCNSLQAGREFHFKDILKGMLKSTADDEKSRQVPVKTLDLPQNSDPFTPVRSADSRTIASVLEAERPQAAAVVLSELPTEKSSEVLGLLGEGIRVSAISRMNSCGRMSAEAKAQIAKAVCKHLEVITKESQTQRIAFRAPSTGDAGEALSARPAYLFLRKAAVILRNLGREIRDGLLGAKGGKDDRAGETAAELMIIWDDIPQIADSSLQKALEGIEPKELALALVGADGALARKIKSNISEGESAALDEEASSLPAHKTKDVKQARGAIVRVLREMYEEGKLGFIEE